MVLGNLTVVLCNDKKIKNNFLVTIAWKMVADCEGVPIMYRNKTDRQLP